MKEILLLMLLKKAGSCFVFLHFADFMHENYEA